MKLLVLLLLVHQAMSCCLPSQHQFTMMNEHRNGSAPRTYSQITLAGDHSRGIQVIKIEANGVTIVNYVDFNNKTIYSYYPQYNYCWSKVLTNATMAHIAKARCVPDGGQINFVAPIVLAGGVPSRIISGTFNSNHTGPVRFDAVITGSCTPIIGRATIAGMETLSVFGNYTGSASDAVLAIPATCTPPAKRSAPRIPAAAFKRSINGPFGHVLHL